MTIAELSDATGVTRHTLRYYERMGLVPLVDRDHRSGHRRYSPDHARWVTFLRNLRQAGMPIRHMRTYARLVARGASSWPERKRILAEHRQRVDETITLLRKHRRLLDQKLAAGCAPTGLGNPAESSRE